MNVFCSGKCLEWKKVKGWQNNRVCLLQGCFLGLAAAVPAKTWAA